MFFDRNMDKGILTNVDMKQPKYKALYTIMFTVLIVYGLLVCVFPVVWIMLSGFKDVQEMYSLPVTLLPKRFSLGKIARVWEEMKIYKYYANTFVMAGGAVISCLIVSGLAGYVLSKLKPRGSKFIFMMFFWIMLMPSNMRMVPLYMTFKEFPLLGFSMLDTYWPIWLMVAAESFNIILFKNFFDGISTSLIEAARIDGASTVGIFLKIILPLSTPIFLVVALFTFNGQLGQFFWPYLLISDTDMTVLGVQIYKMRKSNFTMDYQFLALLFAMLPQLVIFALFSKQIIGGINVGGVKG